MGSSSAIVVLLLLSCICQIKAIQIDEVDNFQNDKKVKPPLFNDPLFKEEWYINRNNGPTHNVTSVWPQYTGKGIVVAVVDDGVDGRHPDLIQNYKFSGGYDFLENDIDPRPKRKAVSGHGNNCAGVIAGNPNNSLCGVGVAYNAEIVGIRLFDYGIKSNDNTESKALVHKLDEVDIYSNSWGPGDMAWQVKGPGFKTSQALKRGVEQGRNGLGAIYTFSAGNGGIVQDSCAYNGYVNSIYTIAINGVNKDGTNPTYAEECPGIMATAYSRDTLRGIGKVITTDNYNDCIDKFGASSAAAAMASGLIALTLEANPKLSWRDMQHIIVRSSRPESREVPLRRGDWKTNAAGFQVSKYYGFGLMDAGSMVEKAKRWKTVPPQIKCEISGSDYNRTIPSSVYVNVTSDDCDIRFLEHVQVKVDLKFDRRGDLGLELQAPTGTASPLTRQRKFDNFSGFKKLSNWIISTLFSWEENPLGMWGLKITNLDTHYYSKGFLYSWSLILYGTDVHPTNNTWVPTKPPPTYPPPAVKVDGKWSPWSYPTTCTKSCGGGIQKRFRACTNPKPKNRGRICPGPATKTETCNTNYCPVDGRYTQWSSWSRCTETCGGGNQQRTRSCTNPRPQYGGRDCKRLGSDLDWRRCNTGNCPVDGGYSPWSSWSRCTKTCGEGTQHRSRTCTNPKPRYHGRDCSRLGNAQEEKQCNTRLCPVHGGYSKWSSWSNCTQPCEGGTQNRTRSCTNPKPKYGGKDCSRLGNASESTKCNEQVCRGNSGYSTWSDWSTCSKTCGGGSQIRNRSCDKPNNDRSNCKGPDWQSRKCNAKSCQVNGGYSPWSSWSRCTKTCGEGAQQRSRTCTNPRPSYHGRDCSRLGNAQEEKPCNTKHCPVNGEYARWTSWTRCTRTCGGGFQYRYRHCTNPRPRKGGRNCIGSAKESQNCNTNSCYVKGCADRAGWCTQQTQNCATSLVMRAYCPNTCGLCCADRLSKDYCQRERHLCYSHPLIKGLCKNTCRLCPVNGGYSQWSPWNTCSRSCGGGYQNRYRTCTSPKPKRGGKDCKQLGLSDRRRCNTRSCPTGISHCTDVKGRYWCQNNKDYCYDPFVKNNCQRTCGSCRDRVKRDFMKITLCSSITSPKCNPTKWVFKCKLRSSMKYVTCRLSSYRIVCPTLYSSIVCCDPKCSK